VKYCSKYWK